MPRWSTSMRARSFKGPNGLKSWYSHIVHYFPYSARAAAQDYCSLE
jgi:hypothetical protein